MAQLTVRFKSKPLVTFISVILFAMLGLTCAQVFWQGYDYLSSTPKSPLGSTSLMQTQRAQQPHYANDIGSAHLFGRAVIPVSNKVVATQEMPDSTLKVQIKGILALVDSNKSMAILSIEHGADKVFKVGAELKAGHEISQILADGIVVDHNGRLEMIRLPRASFADINASGQNTGGNSAVGLGALRAEVLRNPLALEQHIAFVPYHQNGQFAGYTVNAGNKPAMFNKLGLQADDIVASVDGVSISQLAGRMDILTNLSVAKSLRLGIIRNGNEQQLLVDFSQ